MLRNPFVLSPKETVIEAMRQVVNLHFPIYPVCDEQGRLVGTVRGRSLFEQQAYEISAQAVRWLGSKRKNASRRRGLGRFNIVIRGCNSIYLPRSLPLPSSLGFKTRSMRSSCLQCFLPVISGQSQNTGCQSLAIALRGLTLGEFESGSERRLILKEGMLGLMNGIFVGITAALAMWMVAWFQANEQPWPLAFAVFLAMVSVVS